jgi:cell wall-associated NlpC family hydrolase
MLYPSFDARGRFILDEVRKELARVQELNEGGFPDGMSVRQKIVAAAHAAFEQRDSLHYTQDGRRMQGVREQIRPPATPQWEDCSSFVTWCCWAAGAPDPNGRDYDGFGFTGTQIGNGTMVSLDQAQPGDLVFYGNKVDPDPQGGIKHVALYVGNGNVISHGGESGPVLVPVDYRSDRKLIKSYVP